jgi:hypothetical protein
LATSLLSMLKVHFSVLVFLAVYISKPCAILADMV